MPQKTKTRQRIVSLAPSATSILCALGARRHLVGVTKWCKDVADVGSLPRVGDCWALDVADVKKLRPTLVIGGVPYRGEVVAEILSAGLPFLATTPRTLEDIYSDIELLGAIVHRRAAASRFVRRMQREFSRIETQAKWLQTRPRVYCEAWPRPRFPSPPWVDELVGIAGGRSVLPGGKRVTDEDVARARPSVIVLAWTAAGNRSRPQQAFQNPAWQDVPAVRNGHVYAIRDEWLNTPGPPLIRGAHALFDLLRSSQRATGKQQ